LHANSALDDDELIFDSFLMRQLNMILF